jgi:hypothetical protein
MARPQLRYRVTPSGAYDALAPERTNTAPAAGEPCMGVRAAVNGDGGLTSALASSLLASSLCGHGGAVATFLCAEQPARIEC